MLGGCILAFRGTGMLEFCYGPASCNFGRIRRRRNEEGFDNWAFDFPTFIQHTQVLHSKVTALLPGIRVLSVPI